VQHFPCELAVSPDSRHVYVTTYESSSGSVSVIDTASNTVTATFKAGHHPVGVAFAPDGRRAYIANVNSSSVSVINARSE
jgi:YVTN family beta-propeller protein